MADYLVRCACGAETPVSEWAIGAPLRCKTCHRPLEPTDKNTRLAPEEQPRRPRESDLPISPEGRMHARREQTKPSTSPRSVAPRPPTTAPAPLMPSMPEAPAPAPSATNCARCGRVFRGDWDRYHRADGVVCHVCANLATAKPEEEPEPVAQPPEYGGVDYKGVLDNPVLPREDETPADLAERQAQFRKWVLLAAVIALVLAVIGIVTDNTSIPEPDLSQTAEPAPELPPWAGITVFATLFVFRGLNLGLALYMVMSWRDRLPSDFLPANIVTLGAWALGLQLLQVAMSVVPFGGLLWIGVCMYILWDQFDLSFTDFLLLALFLFLLEPLVMVLRTLALAAIGAVAL